MTSLIVLASCGDNKSTSTDTTNTETSTVDTMSSTMLADTTTHDMSKMTPAPDLTGTAGPANFTMAAASGGMMEVEAAKLAQQNASSKDVKDLAGVILNDHSKANSELKKLAESKNIAVPAAMSSEHQAHLDMLRNKTGADFDAAYLNMMDQDHQKDIEMFQQASTTLTDSDLKNFASKTLPTLQKHAKNVKGILAKM
jgi:putative membrane protein